MRNKTGWSWAWKQVQERKMGKSGTRSIIMKARMPRRIRARLSSQQASKNTPSDLQSQGSNQKISNSRTLWLCQAATRCMHLLWYSWSSYCGSMQKQKLQQMVSATGRATRTTCMEVTFSGIWSNQIIKRSCSILRVLLRSRPWSAICVAPRICFYWDISLQRLKPALFFCAESHV